MGQDPRRIESERWLGQAESDLAAAAGTATAGNYNWACFIAQQAAEKAVKAVHIARGDSIERVHSISALIRGDQRHNLPAIPELAPSLGAARDLDRDYIPTRYPNGVPYGMPHEFYDADDAEERLRWAREIVETCRQILPNT